VFAVENLLKETPQLDVCVKYVFKLFLFHCQVKKKGTEESERRKEFGRRVKKYREEKKMSQLDLGIASDRSAEYISRVENGKMNPTFETIYKIADGLNISVKIFLPDN